MLFISVVLFCASCRRFRREVSWQDFFAEISICACETDMNYLDVASLPSAPTAVLFFAVTWKKKERERFLFFFLPSPAKTWIGCSKRILLFVFVCVTPLFFSRKNKKSGVGGKWHSPLVQLDGYRCRTKPDSATRSGRVKGQVRFGVGGCAERPG